MESVARNTRMIVLREQIIVFVVVKFCTRLGISLMRGQDKNSVQEKESGSNEDPNKNSFYAFFSRINKRLLPT